MGKRSKRDRDDRDDDLVDDEADAELARDFVMARLAAARSLAAQAVENIDIALAMFVDPASDKTGKARFEAVELADESLGAAAISIQMAHGALEDIDAEAGEPEPDDDDDDEDEDDADEE